MISNSFLLNARHPMRFLPRDNNIYLAEDGVTEIHGAGYQDERNFLVTIFDPFDLWGVMKGRNMQRRFWETHQEGRATEHAEGGKLGEANGSGDVKKGGEGVVTAV